MRIVNLNVPQDIKYSSNRVVSSIYTVLNFPFKNLFIQFSKLSYIYFLLIGVLQVIPAISITNGVPTMCLPLVFVVFLNMVKDALEDYNRHINDRTENCQIVYKVQSYEELTENLKRQKLEISEFKKNLSIRVQEYAEEEIQEVLDLITASLINIKWEEVEVGDIICVRNKSFIPADIILLSCSSNYGTCYVDTANLDGETNLKIKYVVQEVSKKVGFNFPDTHLSISRLEGYLQCDLPNADVNNFEGLLNITNENIQCPITNVNIMLRGCKLRNTDWILGLVVYTGQDTKIQLNTAAPEQKKSTIEKRTTNLIYLIFIILFLICCCNLTAFFIINYKYKDVYVYLNIEGKTGPAVGAVVAFMTALLSFADMIPISLLVTLALNRYLQGLVMSKDKYCYNPDTNTSVIPRTTELNEELGQIQHIFSDKTGTLTSNNMTFRKCVINSITYGTGLTEIRRTVLRKQGVFVPPEPELPNYMMTTPHVNLYDPLLTEIMDNEQHTLYNDCIDFFLNLALNNSVVSEGEVCDFSDRYESLHYASSSPDEEALVYGARHYGIAFIRRTGHGVILEINGQELHVEVLCNFEFDSVRKRSTVICNIPAFGNFTDRIMLLCKGADTSIIPLLGEGANIQNNLDLMEQLSIDGLRCLCVASKCISKRELEEWLIDWKIASSAVEDRQDKINHMVAVMERNLTLNGITGVEDKLQEYITETLEAARYAGIKVWMLTGDKIETAINISISAGIVTDEMNKIVLEAKKFQTFTLDADLLSNITDDDNEDINISIMKYVIELELSKMGTSCENGIEYALLIDGYVLTFALNEACLAQFNKLCCKCTTIVCCRVSPQQKGSVVKMVRMYSDDITLAIGDGSNDCNMIQSAHVGIGIAGREGRQAFNSSDYGISKFFHLKHLLFVHGRWNYRRTAKFVVYMFYKNIVLVLPVFYFTCVNLFSGTLLYIPMIHSLYNIFLTSCLPVVFGVIEQDVDRETSLKYPELYKIGTENLLFNYRTFIKEIIGALFDSLVCFWVPYLLFGHGNINKVDGNVTSRFEFGSMVMYNVMFVVTLKLIHESLYQTWVTATAFCVNIASFPVFAYMASVMPQFQQNSTGALQNIFSMLTFYVNLVGVCILTSTPHLIFKYIKVNFVSERFKDIRLQCIENSIQRQRLKEKTHIAEEGVYIPWSIAKQIFRGFAFDAPQTSIRPVTRNISKID